MLVLLFRSIIHFYIIIIIITGAVDRDLVHFRQVLCLSHTSAHLFKGNQKNPPIYVCGVLHTYMLSALYACLVPEEARRVNWILWNWRYRWW